MVKNIIQFIRDHGKNEFKGVGNEELKKILDAYKAHGWYMEIKDKDKIVAFALWKILDGKMAKITHVIIHEAYRGNGMLKKMLTLGNLTYPQIEYILYNKAKTNKKKFCSLRRFLHA